MNNQKLQRSRNRFEIITKVKIYEHIENQDNNRKGNLICDAISWDISFSGIRIFTNNNAISEQSVFVLEFSLLPTYTFIIPAKMVRKQRNIKNRSYSYDCGFQFDFTNRTIIQDKLISDIFKTISP